MHLVQIKEDFANFIKKYDQENFIKLMEFLSLILNEYHHHPMKIYSFFKLEDSFYTDGTDNTNMVDLTTDLVLDVKKEGEQEELSKSQFSNDDRETCQKLDRNKICLKNLKIVAKRTTNRFSPAKKTNIECLGCGSSCLFEKKSFNIVCKNCIRWFNRFKDNKEKIANFSCRHKQIKNDLDCKLKKCPKCRFEKIKKLILI